MQRKKIRVVALDLDDTLAGVPKDTKGKVPSGFLSPKIIARVKEEKYDACYGFTARSSSTILNLIKIHVPDYDFLKAKSKKNQTSIDFSDADPCDFLTIKIVENFSRLTGITMSKVSTPDDAGYKCGSGYEEHIKVIEQALLEKRTFAEGERIFVKLGDAVPCWEDYLPKNYDTLPRFSGATKEARQAKWTVFPNISSKFPTKPLPKDWSANSKNNQLLSVVQDLVETYPDAEEIELDVIDDKQEIIGNLLLIDADTEKNWPEKKVSVSVFHHSAFDNTEITFKGRISRKIKEKDTSLTSSQDAFF